MKIGTKESDTQHHTYGKVLDLPTEEREEGTLVTTVLAVQNGCGFVRVHDAEKNRRAIKMTEAILGRGL